MKYAFPTTPTLQITQAWGNVNFGMYPGPSGRHMGVDIGGPVGSPIYTAGDGKVETTSLVNLHGYGRHVIVQHEGFKTLYAHLHKVNTEVGQVVTRGEMIGEMGGNPNDDDPIDGASSGAHLHFEVILPNQPEGDFVKTLAGYTVDPLAYLARLEYGELRLFVTVLASKGVRVRSEANVNSTQVGGLAAKSKHPIMEVVQIGKDQWARLWSLREEYAAVRYGGETLMSVSSAGFDTPPAVATQPSALGTETLIRLDEIQRMTAFLQERKAEVEASQKEAVHAPNS